MASATQSASYSIVSATNRMMDGAESAVNGMATRVGQQVSNAEAAIEAQLRSVLGVGADSKPEGPDDRRDADRDTNSSR